MIVLTHSKRVDHIGHPIDIFKSHNEEWIKDLHQESASYLRKNLYLWESLSW